MRGLLAVLLLAALLLSASAGCGRSEDKRPSEKSVTEKKEPAPTPQPAPVIEKKEPAPAPQAVEPAKSPWETWQFWVAVLAAYLVGHSSGYSTWRRRGGPGGLPGQFVCPNQDCRRTNDLSAVFCARCGTRLRGQ